MSFKIGVGEGAIPEDRLNKQLSRSHGKDISGHSVVIIGSGDSAEIRAVTTGNKLWLRFISLVTGKSFEEVCSSKLSNTKIFTKESTNTEMGVLNLQKELKSVQRPDEVAKVLANYNDTIKLKFLQTVIRDKDCYMVRHSMKERSNFSVEGCLLGLVDYGVHLGTKKIDSELLVNRLRRDFGNNPEMEKKIEAYSKGKLTVGELLQETGTPKMDMDAKADSLFKAKFHTELDSGARAMELKRVGRELSEAEERTGGVVEFQKLGETQNPVSKIQEGLYLERAVVAKAMESAQNDPQAVDKALSTFFGAFKEDTGMHEKLLARLANPETGSKEESIDIVKKMEDTDGFKGLLAAKNGKTSIEEALSKIYPELSPTEIHQRIDTEVKQIYSEFTAQDRNGMILRKNIPQGKSELEKLTKSLQEVISPPSVEKVPTLFDKEEIASTIQLLLSQDPELLESRIPDEDREKVVAFSRSLRQEPASHISQERFLVLMEGLSPQTQKQLSNNLREYVSTQDVMMVNRSTPNTVKALQAAAKQSQISPREFAFKMGLENHREILGGQVLKELGLATFVVPKNEVVFEGATLLGQKSEGIASGWLDGGVPLQNNTMIRDAEWIDLLKMKNRLANVELKVSTDPAAKKEALQLRADIAKLEENFVSPEIAKAIRNQVFIDILCCSADSHIGQYLLKDGSIYNIDFARHLGPQNFKKEGSTCCTLRSDLLDHPAASAPLSKEEVASYREMITHFSVAEEALKKLVGTQEFFKEAEETMTDLRDCLSRLDSLHPMKKEAFRNEIKERYGIETDKETLADIKNDLKVKLKEKLEETKSSCYQKIHPVSFEELKTRIARLELYLQQCERENRSPTLTEATFRMYPDLEIFVKVLGRREKRPFGNLSLGTVSGTFQYRPLERVISDAKKDGLATAEEIVQMDESLANIQKTAQSSKMLETTMDIHF